MTTRVGASASTGSAWSRVDTGAPVGNTELALLRLQTEAEGAQTEDATEQVHSAFKDLEHARKEMRDAIQQMREAQHDSGIFGAIEGALNGDIADLAEVTAVCAAAAATGGAAVPVALAAAGMTMGARVAEKAGLDPKLCAGIAMGGAALGLVYGNPGAASAIVGGAHAVAAGARAGGAVAGVVRQHYDSKALEEKASSVGAKKKQDDARFASDDGIQRMKQYDRENATDMGVVSDIQQDKAQTAHQIASNMGGE